MYKVTSKIVSLKQKVGSIIVEHGPGYARTVEWLKEDDSEDFLTLTEANQLKKYLDEKVNFKDNIIVEVNEEDTDPSIASLASFAKQFADGKVGLSEPIYITQCEELSDYNLPFDVVGHLNEISLK